MPYPRLNEVDVLPQDGRAGALAGRVQRPDLGGPSVVAIRPDGVFDLTAEFPTMRDLADALVMDQSTIGQNLRPLERDGLVCLEQDARDRRRRYVKLTRKGRSRLAAALPLWSEAQARFENSFGKQKAASLRAVLLDIAGEAAFTDRAEAAASSP